MVTVTLVATIYQFVYSFSLFLFHYLHFNSLALQFGQSKAISQCEKQMRLQTWIPNIFHQKTLHQIRIHTLFDVDLTWLIASFERVTVTMKMAKHDIRFCCESELFFSIQLLLFLCLSLFFSYSHVLCYVICPKRYNLDIIQNFSLFDAFFCVAATLQHSYTSLI